MVVLKWRNFSWPRRSNNWSVKKRQLLIIVGSISLLLVLLMILMHLRSSCINKFVYNAVSETCKLFFLQKIHGELCQKMCLERSTYNFHCGNGLYNSPNIFLANDNNKKEIVIKRNSETKTQIEQLYWVDKHYKLHYPNKAEFERAIQRKLLFIYNMTLPSSKLTKLLMFAEINAKSNNNYMESIWRFMHNNEYILSVLVDSEEIFPKIYGVCDKYYAQEFAEPLIENAGGGHISETEWKKRLRAAILILDFVEELNKYKMPLGMCDVNIYYFAITDDRLKYHDLSNIHTQDFIDKNILNGKSCSNNADCDSNLCRSKCDSERKQCIYRQLNNNLQIICDKVFRGSYFSPGLLVTSYSSNNLLNILERCADPRSVTDTDIERPLAPSRMVRDELYTELANIYEILVTKP